jgi:tubulin polyglutamylase TTLL5
MVNSPSTGREVGYFYKFEGSKVGLIKNLMEENGFHESQQPSISSWSLLWSSSPFPPITYKSLLPYQKLNHFPSSFHLTRKDLMNKSISKMELKFGYQHYNFVPKTYILPQ